MKRLLITAAVLAITSGAAHAAGLNEGWYVGGGFGWNHAEDADFTRAGVNNEIGFNEGLVGNLAVGYAWMNGLRAELEGSYRHNGVDSITGAGASGSGGNFNSLNSMANLYYDFKNDTAWVPYIGAGVGASFQDADNIRNAFAANTAIDKKDVQFAYQGIAGVDYWMNDRSAWGLRYNYFASTDGDFRTNIGANTNTDGEYHNHAVMVTYRYGLNAPMVAPAAPATFVPAAAPAAVRYSNPTPEAVAASPYKIYFANDSATVNAAGQAVVNDVIAKADSGKINLIYLTANTDTTGSAAHNERLSSARAKAVRQALMSRGVSADRINIFSNAERNLPVPTTDGVVEPENRVVTIVLQ